MEEMNNKEEYELIRERIKTRPINRKKLFRRTVITAAMAVIFGVLACITFIVLEPVFSNMLTPEETPVPNEVEIPLDEDEMLPTDMIVEDKTEQQTQIIIKETDKSTVGLSDYTAVYDEIYALSRVCQKSIVTVAGVNKDVDWFNNSYESQNITTGLIVANNGIELLVLADSSVIKNSEEIELTFFNELVTQGTIKQIDKNTGLAIVAVPVSELTATVLDSENIAKLGNSKTTRLFASPVFAMGRPLGNVVSIETGMITSKGIIINKPDNNYELYSTDMNGNTNSNGIIYNMQGEVVGLIYQNNDLFSQTTLTLIGITDLKKTIERMSNGRVRTYLGITGTDVTADAILAGVPTGAYVKSIEMGSPAMKAGIQNGDVITKIDGYDITTFAVYTEAISSRNPDDEIEITLERKSGEDYQEIEITVTLEEEQ